MKRLTIHALFLVGMVAASMADHARAKTAKPAPAKPPADNEVVVTAVRKPDEVVVIAPIDPKVVATFPADGGVAPGGVVVLKIVFDQPMTPMAWSFGRSQAGAFPNCLARPRLLNDVHSFALLCTVSPNKTYGLQINDAPDFVSARGRSAKPYLMRFSTSGATTYDMHAALIQAGLTDADDPIMTWNGVVGASASPPPPRPDPAPQP